MGLEENISYVVSIIKANSGEYDLKELMHLTDSQKRNWIEVWAALDAAMARGLVEARDVVVASNGAPGITKRNYYAMRLSE